MSNITTDNPVELRDAKTLQPIIPEVIAESALPNANVKRVQRTKPMWQRPSYWIRRMHLYFGLFLFPWVILYGVTAYLFNHPVAMPDQPMIALTASELSVLPLRQQLSPAATATSVIDRLNKMSFEDFRPLQLDNSLPARYADGFIFGNIVVDGQQYNVLLGREGKLATLRQQQPKAKPLAPSAFEIDGKPEFLKNGKGNEGNRETPSDSTGNTAALMLESGLGELAEQSIVAMTSLPSVQRFLPSRSGEKTSQIQSKVSSVPDLIFQAKDSQEVWNVRYNALAGSIHATKASQASPPDLTWRQYLLRLHLTHGYPESTSAKFGWAIIVDAMAFIMIFWGLSGLVMWWQIKATRRIGFIVLGLSFGVAAMLAVSMYFRLVA